MTIKTRAFAILHTWPDVKNAEYEVVQRIVAAGMNIDARVFVIDNDGYPLWASDRVVSTASPRVTAADCDFVLSLHFQSPKVIDIPTYAALWNPPKFYEAFDYKPSVEKLASHDDLLSCGSSIADNHALNLFDSYGRVVPLPLPTLYHSVPAPHLEPRISGDAKLFYVGINWERITGKKGRHHDLLERLDEADLIEIYGPEMFQGVEPWEGFRNYRGSIPFDGCSILADINRAGVCLAFSSEEHQKSGIMSNRLFEGLAAGAAVIANPHPIVERYFSDCVYVVDDTKGSQELARDVTAILLDIRRNPEEALRRARIGQTRFKDKFTLERSLETLFEIHAGRVAQRSVSRFGAPAAVDVLVCYGGTDADALLALVQTAAEQVGVAVHISLICDEALHASCAEAVQRAAVGAASFRTVTGRLHLRPRDFSSRPRRVKPLGELVATALEGVSSPYVCMIAPGDRWFSDHLAKLAAALDRTAEAYFAASGSILEEPGEGRRTKRRFETLVFDQAWKIVHAVDMPGPGRFLFRASLLDRLPRHLIACLDGLEHRALALHAYLDGPMAQSGSATYLATEGPLSTSDGIVAPSLQVNMIMDSVRADPAWLARIPALRIPPVDLASFDRENAVRVDEIAIGTPVHMRKGESGTALLAEGFSTPEDDLTWINGKAGTIRFRLPNDVEGHRAVILLTVGARKSRRTGEDQVCTIRVEGQTVVDQVRIGEEQQVLRIPLNELDSLEGGDEVRLEIRLQHADRVYDQKGRVVDNRKLGLWIKSLELQMARAPVDYPPIEPNVVYELAEGGRGRELLGFGFASPEKTGTWIDGDSAQLNFKLPHEVNPADLIVRLRLSGRKSQRSGRDQVASFKINGNLTLGDVLVLQEEQIVELPIGDRAIVGSLNAISLTILMQHAEQVYENGRLVDDRRLGLRLLTIEIVDDRAG